MIYRFLRYFLIAALAIYISSCGSDDSMDPTPVPQADCSTLALSMSASTSADCSSLGSVEVSATGGMSPYTFSVDGGSFQSSATFADLEAGTYQVTTKDANDCTSTLSVTIADESNSFTVTATQTEPSGCTTSEGEIEVSADGGGTYEFSINGGAFSSSMTFGSLERGSYDVAARDEQGCTTSTTVEVLSGITLSGHVQPIIDTNCAIPTCHGGTQAPDFRVKSNILANASNIALRTGNGSMPPAGTLDQDLIDTIACWVADGAADN